MDSNDANKHITCFSQYSQMFDEFKSNLYVNDIGALE